MKNIRGSILYLESSLISLYTGNYRVFSTYTYNTPIYDISGLIGYKDSTENATSQELYTHMDHSSSCLIEC